MRYLADTHAILWWLAGEDLPAKASRVLMNPDNEIYVSAASGWEISIKRALGKLKAPELLTDILEEEGFVELPITVSHGERAGVLPSIHNDPFDRMLVAQAQLEKLVVITRDRNIPRYGVKTVWN